MRTRRLSLAVVALSLLPLFGCAIGADLVNPDLLGTLGVDAQSVIPPQGRVVVTFNNTTTSVATFSVAVSDSTSDPTSNAKVITGSNVAPTESRSRVLDCPIGVVTPGQPSADFATDTVAVAVFNGEDAIEVNYTGTPLVSGRDFRCGDVIEIRLVQVGDGADEANFALQVQVLAGR